MLSSRFSTSGRDVLPCTAFYLQNSNRKGPVTLVELEKISNFGLKTVNSGSAQE